MYPDPAAAQRADTSVLRECGGDISRSATTGVWPAAAAAMRAGATSVWPWERKSFTAPAAPAEAAVVRGVSLRWFFDVVGRCGRRVERRVRWLCVAAWWRRVGLRVRKEGVEKASVVARALEDARRDVKVATSRLSRMSSRSSRGRWRSCIVRV
jgi:hypothetical protein